MYTARIADLGPGDFVRVQCVACCRDELLVPDRLRIKGVPLPSYKPVLDLEHRLRCRECDPRGRASVSISGMSLPQVFGRKKGGSIRNGVIVTVHAANP